MLGPGLSILTWRQSLFIFSDVMRLLHRKVITSINNYKFQWYIILHYITLHYTHSLRSRHIILSQPSLNGSYVIFEAVHTRRRVCPHTGIFRPHFTFFARSKVWNRRPSNWTPSMKCLLHIRAAKLFFRVSALQTAQRDASCVKTSKQYTPLTNSSRPPKDQCLITVEECSKSGSFRLSADIL